MYGSMMMSSCTRKYYFDIHAGSGIQVPVPSNVNANNAGKEIFLKYNKDYLQRNRHCLYSLANEV